MIDQSIFVVVVFIKGATSRFAHRENVSLHFSSSPFGILVNLLHPWLSLFLYGLLLSLWCFSSLVNCYFQVSFYLEVILHAEKITRNAVTELF